MVKAINTSAREVCADIIEADGGESRLCKEIEIQRESTKCILNIMSSTVKNWAYK